MRPRWPAAPGDDSAGRDDQIYAVAQGPVRSQLLLRQEGQSLTQGVPTTGRIPMALVGARHQRNSGTEHSS